MQPESAVQRLCHQVEQAVQRSEQDIDVLCMQQALDDEQNAQLSQICFALKQLCIEATNRAQQMEQFAAHTTTKMTELYALYQRLGGKEPKLVHEEATSVTLCATNAAAITLSATEAPPRSKPLRPEVVQQMSQERVAMQQWQLECQLMQDWEPLDATRLLTCRDSVQNTEVQTLALFTVDTALHCLIDTLAQQQHNLRHHQSNAIARFMACERLFGEATRLPAPPSAMCSMFLPSLEQGQ